MLQPHSGGMGKPGTEVPGGHQSMATESRQGR